MRFVVAAAVVMMSFPVRAEFIADMSLLDILKAAGRFTVNDLGVGEGGLLAYTALCTEGDHLYLDTASTLGEKPLEYMDNIRVRRLPQNKVELLIEPGASSKTTIDSASVDLLVRASRLPCSEQLAPEGRRISVHSINGATSASELLKRVKP
ncbi:UNVERIFIED_ORG: hypothetical protein LHK14_13295 [Roseateles sp. XES5]|nr:hypothetical protein [Roseateles sp. XES5]